MVDIRAIVGPSEESFKLCINEIKLEQTVKDIILNSPKETIWASGEASGIDSFTKKAAIEYEREFKPFPPIHDHWDSKSFRCPTPSNCYGFKARNIDIAKYVNKVYCVTFESNLYPCYHCHRATGIKQNHLVSGGCYTMRYAEKLGKQIELIIVK